MPFALDLLQFVKNPVVIDLQKVIFAKNRSYLLQSHLVLTSRNQHFQTSALCQNSREICPEKISGDTSLQTVNTSIDDLKAKLTELYKLKEDLEINENAAIDHDGSVELVEPSWTSTEFPWSKEMKEVLNSTFNKTSLHLTQLKAVNSTMSDKDVLVVLPTGGGKSLCYQLPAMLSKGITIVISPLVSLMTDQVISLQEIGIKAEMLHSKSPLYTLLEVYSEMENTVPNLKLLFITPERISQSMRFLSQLDKCYRMGNLARIAIDEVHCVDQWGSSFRPDYRNLGMLKTYFPDVPILGVTATATTSSLESVKQVLNIPDALEFVSFYPRSNLFYEVRAKPVTGEAVIQDIVHLIQQNFAQKSGIVYCLSRANCESVCSGLQKNGIEAVVYHSALSDKNRNEAQTKWLCGEKKVICATNAFGMGINKTDVRFVIHHSMSKSMETYYQESGRAGRDGLPALCLLYSGFSDIFRNVGLVLKEPAGMKKLKSVIKYSHNVSRCRHKTIADIFDADMESCNQMCDLCNGGYEYATCDMTKTCIYLMEIVQSRFARGSRITGRQLVEWVIKNGKLHHSRPDLESCVTRLLIDGYFKIHQAEIIIVKHLIQGHNIVAWVRS